MQVRFDPSPDLFPFESRWHPSPVGPIHYVDEGTGRPILFLHGNPTWSFLYREIIKRLRPTFRCLAVDYPGFGLSERPFRYGYTPAEHSHVVADLIEGLDLGDLIIMGHDWGGPIGLACAVRMPERVSGLVFGNTWFWPVDRWFNRVFSRFMSTRLLEWAIIERNFFVERLIPLGTATSLTDEVMEHYRWAQPSPAARRGVAEFTRQLTTSRRWLARLARAVPNVLGDRSTLLTWGMRDFAFAPDHFIPRFRTSFRDLAEYPLPQARHFIQEDAPDSIAEAIQARFTRRGRQPPPVA